MGVDFSEGIDSSDSDSGVGIFVSEAIDSSELDEGNDANSLSLSIGVLCEDSEAIDSSELDEAFGGGGVDFSEAIDSSELEESLSLDKPLGTATPAYVFFLESLDLSLSIDSSDELVSPPSKSIPKPFLSPPSKSSPSSSSKNKLNAPLGLLISTVLNLLY